MSVASISLKSVIASITGPLSGVSAWNKISLGLPVPSLPGLWGQFGRFLEPDTGILEAAPKKRSSHQKKRQRQLAGNNQQKPLRNLGRCPACGHFKRSHTLCMNCVKEIQGHWRAKSGPQSGERAIDPEDDAFNYPRRLTRPTEYQEKLAKKEYILNRPRTLPVPNKRK